MQILGLLGMYFDAAVVSPATHFYSDHTVQSLSIPLQIGKYCLQINNEDCCCKICLIEIIWLWCHDLAKTLLLSKNVNLYLIQPNKFGFLSTQQEANSDQPQQDQLGNVDSLSSDLSDSSTRSASSPIPVTNIISATPTSRPTSMIHQKLNMHWNQIRIRSILKLRVDCKAFLALHTT